MIAETEAVLSTGGILWRVAIALFLVVLNGFFVAAEFALVGARRTRIEALARGGNKRAKNAYKALSHLDHYISGTQLGITLASLGLGWVGESALSVIFLKVFHSLPAPFDVIATHAVAATFAFALITFMHIVIGELAPKSLALLFPEKVSLWTAGPLILFSRTLTPFIVFLNGAANMLLKLVGLRAAKELERVHRPEEIQMLLAQSQLHGLIGGEPVGMIRGVFNLSETTAAEVMTPRTSLRSMPMDITTTVAADYVLEHEHSRYPVYEGSIDHVVGTVLARDIWKAQRAGAIDLRAIIRDPLFIPDTKSVESLIRLMQKEGQHLAVVVDEFGGTAGIVTLEDLLEEIVGDIDDEGDGDSDDIMMLADGRIEVRGRVSIGDLNERFGLVIPDDDYTTIGGFVLGRLGRIPAVGDEVVAQGGSLTVTAIHRRSVDKLVMRLPPERIRAAPDDMDAPPE